MKAHSDRGCELYELSRALSRDGDEVSLMLDIFTELGLVSLDQTGEVKRASLRPVKGKLRLEESEIYSNLKRRSQPAKS